MTVSLAAIAHECSIRAREGTITFPEIVGKLLAIGAESYHADFHRSETTYYMPSGETHVEPLALPDERIADAFSASGVEQAVRLAQAGKVKYQEFLQHVMQAGCIGYFVCLTGKRVIYFGRTGDNHVEFFPQ